jgi:hypothetical protein
MLQIPILSVGSQELTVSLSNQAVQLKIYQRITGLYIDVYVNNTLIIGGIICHDRNLIIRDSYLGFVGDLTFIDTQGTDDPYYTELGTRYILIYLEAADL